MSRKDAISFRYYRKPLAELFELFAIIDLESEQQVPKHHDVTQA